MIAVNELRVGNWVNANDSETGMCYKQCTPALIDAAKFLSPIPLTLSILEKAGFVNDAEYKILKYFKNGKHWHDYIFKEENDGLHYGCLEEYTYSQEQEFISETQNPILFIHQLQNLVFSLTGEELQIQL